MGDIEMTVSMGGHGRGTEKSMRKLAEAAGLTVRSSTTVGWDKVTISVQGPEADVDRYLSTLESHYGPGRDRGSDSSG